MEIMCMPRNSKWRDVNCFRTLETFLEVAKSATRQVGSGQVLHLQERLHHPQARDLKDLIEKEREREREREAREREVDWAIHIGQRERQEREVDLAIYRGLSLS